MQTDRPAEPPVEPSIDWRRVARGLHWIGFGIFLLLTTLGFLSWSFWLRAAEFWPVLLIGLGLRMMLARRAPATALISPLVIHGTLALIALSGDRPWVSQDWQPVSVSRKEGIERYVLEADLAFSHLDVAAKEMEPALLVTGRAQVRDGSEPVSVAGETVPRVRLTRPHDFQFMVGTPPRQAFELQVADAVPVRLDLDLAFTGGDIDLSHGALAGAGFDGAFNDTTLHLGPPSDDVRLDWEGAFNHLEVVVPDEVPVSVSSDGFLNLVDGRDRRDRSGPGYHLSIDGAFNRVVVRAE